MFDISNYISDTPANQDVIVTHSNSVKHAKSRDKHLESEGSYQSRLTAFGVTSNMAKEDRKFKVQVALENNRIKTIDEAMDLVSVSRPTAKKYLKELGYTVNPEGIIGRN